MIFCLGEGQYEKKGAGFQKNNQIFNTPVSSDVFNSTKNALNVKDFKLPIAVWVDVNNIDLPTKEQRQMGGYLKTLDYKEAWAEMWSKMSSADKSFFKTLPHFNAEIFEKITGIKIEDSSLVGKEVSVTIDGVTYSAEIKKMN